jgi:hypothetical protein
MTREDEKHLEALAHRVRRHIVPRSKGVVVIYFGASW